MRKFIYLLIITLFLLSGCSASGYQLVHEDGNYYILLNGQSEPVSDGGMIAAPTITFSSMKEMKSDIQKGNFTQEELEELSRFYNRDERGAIIVCNLDKLYKPTYPADVNLTVCWHGYYYTWKFDSNISSTSFGMSFTAKENYTKKEDPVAYRSSGSSTITSVTTTSDRNATVINYTTADNRTMQSVSYKIETGAKTLLVEERHDLTKNAEMPYSISIYGVQEGQYFHIDNIHPAERPSVEWLSQFGLQEYIESPAS